MCKICKNGIADVCKSCRVLFKSLCQNSIKFNININCDKCSIKFPCKSCIKYYDNTLLQKHINHMVNKPLEILDQLYNLDQYKKTSCVLL